MARPTLTFSATLYRSSAPCGRACRIRTQQLQTRLLYGKLFRDFVKYPYDTARINPVLGESVSLTAWSGTQILNPGPPIPPLACINHMWTAPACEGC